MFKLLFANGAPNVSATPHIQVSGSESTIYDILFIGAGVSSTFTLIELLARHERQKVRFVRVLLVDRYGDFFKGTPYGNRSGDLGLIISRLADFLPDANCRQFGEWLADNREQVFEKFFALGGDCVENWRSNYWHQVEAGELAELYLPRYVLGLYFEHIATRAIERAHELGVARCDIAVGEVVNLDRAQGAFKVVTRNQSGQTLSFHAHRVVLGLGTTPTKRMLRPHLGALPASPRCALIDDPFEPGISDMLERIRAAAHHAQGAKRRLLIIGSNAGALDVIFNLMNDRTIAGATRRIDVISPSGKLPELYTRPTENQATFVPRALIELAARESILADDILESVRHDLECARRDGFAITDTLSTISAAFNSLRHRLAPEEKLRFACVTGMRIGELQRRVGLDYWGVTDDLLSEGKLVVIQGRFPQAELELGQEDLLAIINCSGGERLSNQQLHSALMRNLLGRAWVRPTGSEFGIRVNDDMESDTPGLYVIGPMLTGNVLQGESAWNLEHFGRITQFAHKLAAHLHDHAFAENPT